MNCKSTLIGIRGLCDESTAPFFYYINDLPGITTKKAANVADYEIVTGVALMERSIELGVNRVKDDLINALLGLVKFNTIGNSAISGRLDNSYQTNNTAQGQRIEISRGCRLQSIYLPYVKYLVNYSGSITITITDGSKVTTFEQVAVADQIGQIDIQYKAITNAITVTIRATNNTPLQVSDGSLLYHPNGVFRCDDKGCLCSDFAYIQSTTGDGKANGLQMLVQTICDDEKLFCEVAKFSAKAAWYSSGIWFLEELLASDRLNVYTIYGVDEAADQIMRWNNEYDKELNGLIKRLPKFLLTLDSCCLECDKSAWKYAMP